MTRYLAIFVFLFANFTFAQDKEPSLVTENFNLIDSLNDVLNNHKLIKATQIDIKASILRVKQAKGGYYPSFDLTANYGHEHINKYGSGNNTQLAARDATAKFTQTITDFGLTDSTVKTSELAVKQSKPIETQIKNDYIQAYNNLTTIYLELNNIDEALKTCNKSIAINP